MSPAPARPTDLPRTESVTQQVVLDLGGLYCGGCSGVIAAALRQVQGVRAVHVDATVPRATVQAEPSTVQSTALVDAVHAAGYRAWASGSASARALRAAEERRMLWRLFVAAFCMMQVMTFAAPSWLYGPEDIEPTIRQLLNWGAWLMTLPVVVFSAGPIVLSAAQALRQKRVDMNLPVALAVLVTFWAGTVATLDPAGPLGDTVYFDSLTMFVTFLLGGRWLEMRLRHRAWAQHESRIAALPQPALRVLGDGNVEPIDAGAAAVGDRLRVATGAVFAADGRVLSAPTLADESLVTGESAPVAKAVGDEVLGGSVNVGAPVDIEATRVGSASRQGVIEALMGQTAAQRTPGAGDEGFARYFTAAVLLLSALGYVAWHAAGSPQALWVAVSVLIVTCPCALSLAAPTARRATAQALLREQVLVKDTTMVDRLARVNHLMIDKTGTLTHARPQVSAVTAAPGIDDSRVDELRAAAAALASWSVHPKAQAVAALEASATPLWAQWQQVREWPGLGLEALDLHGRRFRLGAPRWVADRAAGTPRADMPTGDTLLFAQTAPEPLALLQFELRDTLRPDAAATLRTLAQRGLKLTLLSGDRADRGQVLAQQLGLGDVLAVHAEHSPEQKLQHLRDAQAAGDVVAMVGDGLNDAPVLAAADVSIAMGHGVDAARARADAVLLSDNLAPLTHAHALALRGSRLMRSNLRWAAAYNFACVPLALAGLLPPWAAGLGMAASSLFVVARSHALR